MTNDIESFLGGDDVPEHDEVLKAIGKRIRQARVDSGLRGADVAKKLGCSVGWLYALESGKQNFTIQIFRRLLKTLGLEFHDVFISSSQTREKTSTERLNALASRALLQLGSAAHALAEVRAINDELRALTESPISVPKQPDR